MKKRYFIIAVIALFLSAGWLLETRQAGWIPLRTAVTTDDTPLEGTTSGTTFNFADKPLAAVPLKPQNFSADVIFYGTAAADKTVNYIIYAWKADGPAKYLCNGVATTGTAITGATNTFWADTITIVTNNNNCYVTDSAVNRVAVLHLGDLQGYEWVYCEFDIVSANIAAASCQITGY